VSAPLTPERLRLLRTARGGRASDAAPRPPADRIMVELVPGPGAAGAPLLLPPPVSGSAYWYPGLLRLLPARAAVFGFESPGLHGERSPLGTVEEMAAAYLRAALARLPRGPFRLAGYSMGGTLAVEMAGQLRRAGVEVDRVVLIDTTAPRPAPAAAEPEVLRRFVTDVAGAVGRSVDADRLLAGAGEPAALRAVLVRAGLLPDGADEEFVARRYAVFRANMHALQRYDPAPYPGPVELVRAAGSPDAGRAAWSGLAGGAGEVVLPGDHYSIWSAAGLPALAAVLRDLL